MTSDLNLNLARKWRSQSFDHVVGQELPVRMLKNSLYRACYFPVYLFSGQRGCGKTTAARLFAAALGCDKLEEFRTSPRDVSIPCRTCDSCRQVREGRYPDFIEIDAASHTGVDNVRQLIESSSLMPLISRKRVYLIDEAHMLSKAAFNALLKVLEEPPPSALFILATTDPGKIIETVRSRCFQLFFRPIPFELLCEHLKHVCEKEAIRYEPEGLEQIVRETDGSARDALNMVEQVRFSAGAVTKDAVLNVLGHAADEQLSQIAQGMLSDSPAAFTASLESMRMQNYSATFIWRRLMECVRAAIWVKYGVVPESFVGDEQAVRSIAESGSVKRLHAILEELYRGENILARTTEQHGFLQMVLLRLCARFNTDSSNDGGGASPAVQVAAATPDNAADVVSDELEEEDEDDIIEEDDASVRWGRFIAEVEGLSDQLLVSIFKQVQSHEFDATAKQIKLTLPTDFALFGDTVAEGAAQWQPMVDKIFGTGVKISCDFSGQARPRVVPTQETAAPAAVQGPAVGTGSSVNGRQPARSATHARTRQTAARVDVSDVQRWPNTNLVLQHFPGVVMEMETRANGTT